MTKNRKRATTLATAGAVAAIAIGGGVAWAAFSSNQTASASGGAETFAPITVAGAQQGGALLPGEKANVQLTLTNPNNNVKAQVSEIKADGVAIVAGSIPATAEDGCKTFVLQHHSNPNNSPLPTLAKGGTSNYILNEGVEFNTDAPIECQGMQWTTSWKVSFTAVR